MPIDAQRVQAVFLAAVEAADGAAQAALLDRECRTDLELRQRVEVLLQERQETIHILDQSARASFGPAPADATLALGPALGAGNASGADIEKTWGSEAPAEPAPDVAGADFGKTWGDEAGAAPTPDVAGAEFGMTWGDEAGAAPNPDVAGAEFGKTWGDEAREAPDPGAAEFGKTWGDEAGEAPEPDAAGADMGKTLGGEAGAGPERASPGALADNLNQTAQFLPAGDFDPTCNSRAATIDSSQPSDGLTAGRSGSGAGSQETRGPERLEGHAPPGPGDGLLAPRRALEGVVVPGYEILEELGRGGMGVVYKARHIGLQRLVALKMILAGVHAGTALLARFRAEAEAVAQLQHPNIVQIYETGEHEGMPYFSLEFVEGGSLDRRMRESPTAPRAAATLVETLARTMDVAHQRGIVHRDLKPGNILLALIEDRGSKIEERKSKSEHRKSKGEEPRSSSDPARSSILDPRSPTFVPKIADFGLVKRVDDDSGQTQSGAIIGTPCYMAPEQAEGKVRAVGPPADIYALGAILYEMLVGRPPFKAGRPIDTIRQVIEQDPVPPRQLEPRVPPDLETICLKCLAKEPARRYATALDLADDLRRYLNGEPVLARATPAWERAWKWGKRRPAIVALLGVSVAAVVAMGLFVVWHNVSLRGDLDQARAEERLARKGEQQALEGQRLARVQSEGQQLLDDARLAVAARDWPNARLHLTKVLTATRGEARLAALKVSAQDLLKRVEGELRVQADRGASQARLQKFGSLRDQAQFLGTLYTGMDLAANLKATRATVQEALAVYGVSVAKDGPPTLDPYLNAAQKAEILEDCYQLLLILAETNAQLAAEKKDLEQRRHLRQALRYLDRALRFGVPTRAYHLRRARYLGRLGDAAGAAQAAKAARDASVLHVLDHFLIADEYYRSGSFTEAIAAFNRVLERKPAHFWAQYLNALCLLRQHRPAEARAQLSACLAQRSDFVWLYLLRGFAQGELKEWAAADADFQKALRMPLDDYARYVLLVNRGAMRVRQDRCEDAVADLKSAIALQPSEYQAHVNLAHAYRGLKKLDLALEQLQRAVQLEPELALLYRLRGRLHLERNEPALALKDFDQTIRRDSPNSPFRADDHVERGRLLLRAGKYPPALASFDAALRRDKDHSRAQRLRAQALFHLGRFKEVLLAFDRYLEKGKPLASVYRGRGLARAELGKYPGAIEDFTKALELEPTSAVQAYRGWAHLVCDAPKLALRDFELAIKLDGKNGDAYNGRGFVLAGLGQYREAMRDADDAIRHGPRSPRLLYNAARIYAQCPRNDLRALDLIRAALELLPADQRARFWSAYIRTDAALQTIRRYPRFLRLEAEMSQGK